MLVVPLVCRLIDVVGVLVRLLQWGEKELVRPICVAGVVVVSLFSPAIVPPSLGSGVPDSHVSGNAHIDWIIH
jgi:hypothetical protein